MGSKIDLEGILERKFPSPRWAIFRELRQGTGYGKGKEGRIDFAAFATWEKDKGRTLAFEVKRSRSDFKRELANPDKRKWAETQFGECYFVVPYGLVKPAEVPEGWGLLQATKTGTQLRNIVIPKQRRVEVGQTLMFSILRRAARDLASKNDEGLSSLDHGPGRCIPTSDYVDMLDSEAEDMRKAMKEARDAYSPLVRLASLAKEYEIEINPYLNVRELLNKAMKVALRNRFESLSQAKYEIESVLKSLEIG